MIAGIILFFAKSLIQKNSKQIGGDDKSVYVGGDNSGIINTGNLNSNKEPSSHPHSFLSLAAWFTEIIGIGVTLWHAYHMLNP
jgi:hypothetical protein